MVAIWAYRLCRVSTMAILRYMGLRTCRPWLVLQTRKIAYVYLWMWTFAFVNSRSSEVATMHAVLKLREIARRSPWEFSYVNWNVLVLIIAVILLVGVSYRIVAYSVQKAFGSCITLGESRDSTAAPALISLQGRQWVYAAGDLHCHCYHGN